MALRGPFRTRAIKGPGVETNDIAQLLKEKQISLLEVPAPAGNYQPFVRSGNLVFINQYALKEGKLINPGKNWCRCNGRTGKGSNKDNHQAIFEVE